MEKMKLTKDQVTKIINDVITSDNDLKKHTILELIANIFQMEDILVQKPEFVNYIIEHINSKSLFKDIFCDINNIKKYSLYVKKDLISNYYCVCADVVKQEDFQEFFVNTIEYVNPQVYCTSIAYNNNTRKLNLLIDDNFVKYVIFWHNTEYVKYIKTFINFWCTDNIDKSNHVQCSDIIRHIYNLSRSNASIFILGCVINYIYDVNMSIYAIDNITNLIKDILLDLCQNMHFNVINTLSKLRYSSIEFCKTFSEYLNWYLVKSYHASSNEFTKTFSNKLHVTTESTYYNDNNHHNTFTDVKNYADKLNSNTLQKSPISNITEAMQHIAFYIIDNCDSANSVIKVFDLFNNIEYVNIILNYLNMHIKYYGNKYNNMIKILTSNDVLVYLNKRGIASGIIYIIGCNVMDESKQSITLDSDLLIDIVLTNKLFK